MSAGLRLEDPGQTAALGGRIAQALRADDVVLLEGPLGVGKTALVRAIVAGLGGTDDVASPTFVLVRHHRGRLPLVHADLYRLESEAEVAALGLLEVAEGGVLAVEWADRTATLDGADGLRLRLDLEGEARLVTVMGGPPHLVDAVRAG